MALLAVLPGCAAELLPLGTGQAAAAVQLGQQASGPVAWLMLAALGASLVVVAWHRWRAAELVAALVLVGTAAWLVAGRFTVELAAAWPSAGRWPWPGSCWRPLVWQRQRLALPPARSA